MAQTKTKPKAKENGVSAAVRLVPEAFSDVLTLAEAAGYLRLREAYILELVRSQGLPGRSAGREWRFLKSALQQWLAGSQNPQARKAAQLALAGKYKDDPDLLFICKEAYRQRGRTLTEGE